LLKRLTDNLWLEVGSNQLAGKHFSQWTTECVLRAVEMRRPKKPTPVDARRIVDWCHGGKIHILENPNSQGPVIPAADTPLVMYLWFLKSFAAWAYPFACINPGAE
jgi:hypothetical protein